MPYVTQTETVGETSVSYSFESYEEFLDFTQKAEESKIMQPVNNPEASLSQILRNLSKAVEEGNEQLVDVLSQAYQRIKSVQTVND